MKTNDKIKDLARRRYISVALIALILGGLIPGTVLAQRGRNGGGNNGFHNGGDRQSTMRNAPSGIQGGDRRMPGGDRTFNQPPVRNNQPPVFNHGQSQPGVDRNFHPIRGNQPGFNGVRNSNAGNPTREPNRGNSIDRNFGQHGNNANPGRFNNDNRRPYTFNRPAYRPIYRYDRRPVYDRYNPSWRYGYLPGRNSCFYNLPSSYFSISFGGFGYRYWDGVFYRPYNNLFTVVAPPVGICINILPQGYRRIYVGNYPYYYFNGTYYDQRGDNYYVVSPPVGAVVESLPEGYDTVVIDGETYYTVDGAQYKPAVQENGEIWYEVIKANG